MEQLSPARVETIYMVTSPLAYFITFRTYGTWLHGDARGSFRAWGGPWPSRLGAMPRLERAMAARLRDPPVRLDDRQRAVVARTILDVSTHRAWSLHAVSVRLEHVHVLVTAAAPTSPEKIMTSMKAWSTRRLVESGSRPWGTRTWSRHGSTRYVWTPCQLEAARQYINSQ